MSDVPARDVVPGSFAVAAARARTRTFFAMVSVAAALTLVALILLPHDRYIRAQDLRLEAYTRLGWIYERIHFDPTPIDIAFIGSSHTMNGVNGALVADTIKNLTGKSVNVANLALPRYGRNLHWLVVRELLSRRHVKTLVLEVNEAESRESHPLFAYFGDVQDVLSAPPIIDPNWLTDVLRMPMRQLRLATETWFPQEFGLKPSFDPSQYDGHDVDNTDYVQVNGQALTHMRTSHPPLEKLDGDSAWYLSHKNLHRLGPALSNIEWHFTIYYLNRILALAHEKGVMVKFLYLPVYKGPHTPLQSELYAGHGDLVRVGDDVLSDGSNWYDFFHLNVYGATKASRQIGEALAADVSAWERQK